MFASGFERHVGHSCTADNADLLHGGRGAVMAIVRAEQPGKFGKWSGKWSGNL